MNDSARRPAVGSGFGRPLNTPSVAEAVAAALRSRILDGDLTEGSELPTEAVLLEEFPVSRPSLREAYRILETESLVTVRRGKKGGTVIKHPTADTAAYHLGLLLHAQRTSLEDLAVARSLLEPISADLVARRRDHVSIGRRLAVVADEASAYLHDGRTFTRIAADFHDELVKAAGNDTLTALVGVLESIWSIQEQSWAASAVDEGEYPAMGPRRDAVRAHLRIAEAIQAGDPAEAARLTGGHVKAISQFVVARGGRVRVLDDYGGRRQPRQ